MLQVSSQHRVLILPHRPDVANLIPHARRFTMGQQDMLALPHGHDEVRLLRNLGIQAPAPILWQYDWCGDTPFKTQRETAALLSTNYRAYVLSEMGCVDADTEYLSPTGWKRIADYVADDVAQYYPETGAIEFVTPTEFVKLPCDEMLRFKTSRGVDQLLSPEHRMLVHAYGNPDKYEVVEAATMYQRMLNPGRGARSEISYSQATIPTTFTVATPGIPLTSDEIRLMVAVKADGHYPPRRTGTRVHVRVKKRRKKERLRRLLHAAGVHYSESQKDYPTAKGFSVFIFNAPEHSKTYDTWWPANEAQRRVIADEVLHWDGSVSADRHRFHTTVAGDADFIQYVLASVGQRARVLTAHRVRRGRVETTYTVYVHAGTARAQLYGRDDAGPKLNIWPEPSTDGFKYCFRVPTSFLLFRRNGCIFASGNTGKTRAALHALNYLKLEGKIQRTLVVAPLSTLNTVWADEIFLHFPHLTCCVVYGTRAKRLKLLDTPADVYIINHDGVKVVADALAQRKDINTLLIDELAVYRTPGAKRSKQMRRMAQNYKYVWGLTGSPTPNAPTDAWSQARIVTPHRAPTYFKEFQARTMLRVSEFIWVPRNDSANIVSELLKPCVRFTRAETVELPPVVIQDRHVGLSPSQQKVYDAMLRHCYLAYANHEVKAVNEGVLLNKLLQICTGAVYSNKGVITMDMAPRLKLLTDLIEEAGQKVLVFVPFVHALELVADHVRKHCSVATVSGATTKPQRDDIFHKFQNQPDPHVIVAHPATMSHGLTLTAANCVVWFSPTASLDTYEQANARVSRPGQQHKQLIANIWGAPAEKRIYKRLKNKSTTQGVLLDMLEGVDDGT